MTTSRPFESTWPATPECVPAARRHVVAYLRDADCVPVALDDVALAVSEAVTNAVLHAYCHRDEPGEVRISVEADTGVEEVLIQVDDDGRGMAPRTNSPGAGVGLSVIGTVTTRFESGERPDGGTRLCMWFKHAESCRMSHDAVG